MNPMVPSESASVNADSPIRLCRFYRQVYEDSRETQLVRYAHREKRRARNDGGDENAILTFEANC